MKFDVVVGNPPYQTKRCEHFRKTQAVWHKFAELSCDLTKENGYTCLIHPSGWRNSSGMFAKTKEKLCSRQIEYLEIHCLKDGNKVFGVSTRYDWYVRKNSDITHDTEIVQQDGVVCFHSLKNIDFIPNCLFDTIFSLLAKDNEEKTEVMYSRTSYDHRNPCIRKQKEFVEILYDSSYHNQKTGITQKDKNEDFIYPVVYSTPLRGPTIYYSNTNKKGHFGIQKLILNTSQPIGFFIDEKGEYGMSQYCAGIVGDSDYLKMVADVITNQKTNGFAEFMEACHFIDKIFNKEVISKLRKDFWKEFLN